MPIANIQFYKKKLLSVINGSCGKSKKWRRKFTQTLNCHIPWKRGELQKKWDTWKIRTPGDNVKEQDPKRRREGIPKLIGTTNKDPYKNQKSRLLTRGLPATHKLGELNVEVQNITILYQSPKQYKN